MARPKLSLMSFPAGLAACFRCVFKGVHLQGAIRFLGYVDGSCNDARHQKTDEGARQFGKIADEFPPGSEGNKEILKQTGHSGTSSLAKHLPYLDMVDSFCSPFCHAVVGMLKQFIGFLLSKEQQSAFTIPKQLQELMIKRAEYMVNVMDRGRPYKCIVEARGSYVMEDRLNFLVDDSQYIMANIFDYNPQVGEAIDRFVD